MIAKTIAKRLVPKIALHAYSELKTVFARPAFASCAVNYDQYWEKREFIAIQPRYPVMADMIGRGERVLDVGCGDGGFLTYLKARKNVDELGIDVSETSIQLCRERGISASRSTIFAVRDECVQARRAFDVVVISEVIEHVSDSEELLKAAWQVTRRSLIISFPNIAYWPHRLRLVFGRNPVQWAYFQGEHLRFWSVPDFIEWLQALNLAGARISPNVVATSGTMHFGLAKTWPNLFANQVLVRLDREGTN